MSLIGMKSVVSALCAVSFSCLQSLACSTKFRPAAACDTLAAKLENDILHFSVHLTPPAPGEDKRAYLDKQRRWADSLFTTYPLFDCSDSATRLNPPTDATLAANYARICMTKATATRVVEESFIEGLSLYLHPCSPKFVHPQGVCDILASKSNQELLIFSINLTRPSDWSVDSPENRARKRRWSDSLFTTYPLFSCFDSTTRLASPPDAQLEWNYNYVCMTRGTAFQVVEESFVGGVFYSSELPRPAGVRPLMKRPRGLSIGSLDLLGREVNPHKPGGWIWRYPRFPASPR